MTYKDTAYLKTRNLLYKYILMKTSIDTQEEGRERVREERERKEREIERDKEREREERE